ncbi:MAG: 5'/3'-nucleotidase SurE [Cyclobacteriaceae bacterium]|nr:5'/3'-nucleotidase SurE [Cyclobacteriaceae bacterium]
MSKPLILVSNDDGIIAHGLKLLIELMKDLGEVIVVAPDGPQSGMGHAITIGNTLRLSKTDHFEGITSYQCSGTPADCVKIAKGYVLKGRKPDLVVSGINHGSNTSISVIYSGTMSAAIEGAVEEIPSIGFSLCDYAADADFSHVKEHVVKIAEQVLAHGLPKGVALNVNFPPKQKAAIKGIKICRQTRAKWQEEFDRRIDPNGRQYFWLTGSFIHQDNGEDNDEWAIANNYTSVVPVSFDLTAYHAIAALNKDWDLNG